MIGLAEAERQSDHQIGSDSANDLLRESIGIGEELRHHPRGPDYMTGT
ncbi:hypothetical protein ACVW04_005757 [Bradyrhizobium sp. LM2.3]